MIRTCLKIVVFALLLAVPLAAQTNKNSPSAERLASLTKQQSEAEAAFYMSIEALPATPEGEKKYQELQEAYDKGQAERIAAAFELAKGDPKSEVGFAALEWILTNPASYRVAAGKSALELVTETYAINPKVGRIVAWVGTFFPGEQEPGYSAAQALIGKVAEKNPDRSARGQAELALATQAGRKFAVAEYKKSAEVDALAGAAEKAYESILKNYADTPRLMDQSNRTLGDIAKRELFELRNLRVGKSAPNIEGDDLDGKSFKLSEYRGKVTVLVFWASWCGPCMAMVPHERKLVAQHKDKPFVLVGVNGDEDRAKAKQVSAKEEMTWRSFWNGPKGPEGLITDAWNVHAWPTIYVLDGQGVIRFRNVHGATLDEAVAGLLAEKN